MSRMVRLGVICVVAIVLIGGLLAYRAGKLQFLSADGPIIVQNDGAASGAKNGGKGAVPAAPPLPVIAERAVLTPNDTVVEAVGTGRSAIGVTLFPPVAGEVRDVLFHAGDEVKTGQVLLILDSAREKLARDLAAVQVRDAKQLLDRYEKARPRGAVSDSEVDEARTALAEARIRLDQASVDLDDRTILAPFDGMMGISAVEPGDRIEKTTAIATLDNIDSVLVDFEVSETRFRDVKPGQSVRVTTWSLPGEKFEGVVDVIGSRVDPQSRTFAVRARIPNPDGRLRAGMSFAVYIDIAGQSYPAVPEISVLWGDKGTYVWRIEDNKVSRVPVRVVKRTTGRILLDGPIKADDLIVVEGVQRLRPGREVAATIRSEDQGIAQRSGSTDGGS